MNESRLNELIIKYLNQTATAEELKELHTWLLAHPSFQLEMQLLEDYWQTDSLKNADLDQGYARLQEKIHQSERRSRSVSQAGNHASPFHEIRYLLLHPMKWVAAFLLLLLMAGGMYKFWRTHHNTDNQPPKSWEIVYDQPGMKSRLILPDSTEVWLNGDTRLYYSRQFGRETREVWLSGEAYFKVKHDPSKAFIIHTTKMNIRVLGTEFNVKCYPDDPLYETSLINGAILVTLKDRPEDRIILKPKEKLVIFNDQVLLQKHEGSQPVPPTLAEKPSSKLWVTDIHYFSSQDSVLIETGWIEGKLVFRDENFSELAKRFERWYGYHFRFMDDSVKQYHFTGIFEHETLEQALKALQIAEKFHFQIQNQDSTVVIY
ncbi:FecR family protein [Thermoflavifilum aggregans]|uniref:FecR family protein n=1 Tax=Thermoflavifilum aggregans TaxID=454188 RepID=UPI0014762777|nr:FecR family protein [Thermoflavifilum aggregans]